MKLGKSLSKWASFFFQKTEIREAFIALQRETTPVSKLRCSQEEVCSGSMPSLKGHEPGEQCAEALELVQSVFLINANDHRSHIHKI